MAASVVMEENILGKQNDVMLDYLRDNRRFADLFNGGLFAGEQVISSSDLVDASENYTEFREDITKSSSTPRARDVKKYLRSGTELRVLAIEDQSYVDLTMPWRCMNYDALEYGRQMHEIQAQNKELKHFNSDSEKLSRFQKTARVIGTVMGVDTFMMNKNRYEKEGEYNMCQAIREMCEDNWNEGVEVGTLNAIKNLMETLTFTASQAMDALKIPAEEREKYMQLLNS